MNWHVIAIVVATVISILVGIFLVKKYGGFGYYAMFVSISWVAYVAYKIFNKKPSGYQVIEIENQIQDEITEKLKHNEAMDKELDSVAKDHIEMANSHRDKADAARDKAASALEKANSIRDSRNNER